MNIFKTNILKLTLLNLLLTFAFSLNALKVKFIDQKFPIDINDEYGLIFLPQEGIIEFESKNITYQIAITYEDFEETKNILLKARQLDVQAATGKNIDLMELITLFRDNDDSFINNLRKINELLHIRILDEGIIRTLEAKHDPFAVQYKPFKPIAPTVDLFSPLISKMPSKFKSCDGLRLLLDPIHQQTISHRPMEFNPIIQIPPKPLTIPLLETTPEENCFIKITDHTEFEDREGTEESPILIDREVILTSEVIETMLKVSEEQEYIDLPNISPTTMKTLIPFWILAADINKWSKKSDISKIMIQEKQNQLITRLNAICLNKLNSLLGTINFLNIPELIDPIYEAISNKLQNRAILNEFKDNPERFKNKFPNIFLQDLCPVISRGMQSNYYSTILIPSHESTPSAPKVTAMHTTIDGKIILGYSDGSIKFYNPNPDPAQKDFLITDFCGPTLQEDTDIKIIKTDSDGKIITVDFKNLIKIWTLNDAQTPVSSISIVIPEEFARDPIDNVSPLPNKKLAITYDNSCLTTGGKLRNIPIYIYTFNPDEDSYSLTERLQPPFDCELTSMRTTDTGEIISRYNNGTAAIWQLNPETQTHTYFPIENLPDSPSDGINTLDGRIITLQGAIDQLGRINHKNRIQIQTPKRDGSYSSSINLTNPNSVAGFVSVALLPDNRIISLDYAGSVIIWTPLIKENLTMEQVLTIYLCSYEPINLTQYPLLNRILQTLPQYIQKRIHEIQQELHHPKPN